MPHYRFYAFLASFAVLTALLLLVKPWLSALLIAFDLSVGLFALLSVRLFQSNGVPGRIQGDDGGRVLRLLISTIIVGVVFSAVGWMMSRKDSLATPDFLLAAASLVMGWLFINLIYAFHYTHLYYGPDDGFATHGLQFPGSEAPVFSDFCYFAFIIGMTCQVSDVVITRREMRRVAVFQGIIAFVFNLFVLALTINILSGAL